MSDNLHLYSKELPLILTFINMVTSGELKGCVLTFSNDRIQAKVGRHVFAAGKTLAEFHANYEAFSKGTK